MFIVSEGKTVKTRPNAYANLREGLTDITRQIEDLSWLNLSGEINPNHLDDQWSHREQGIERYRTMRKRSPLAKQAFMLLKNYVLGQGVTLRPNNKTQVAKIVDEFWDDPVNQSTFTSHSAMVQALDTLFTDGDLFLVLFPDEVNGVVQLGWLDAALVQDIITDPDNWRMPMWYKVKKPNLDYDFNNGEFTPDLNTQSEFVWYRDWRNEVEIPQPKKLGRKPKKFYYDPSLPHPSKVMPGVVYHIAINKRGKFGESEIAAAADWLKAHKDFMEDRATLSRAAAMIAWKKKRKGGAGDIASQVEKLQSSLTQNISRWERNPPFASGSTIVENEGSSMEWVKTDTGGANADFDERKIRMMAGAAMGIMSHYFGDDSSANLSTAEAMELPMLKMYEGWQKLLGDSIKDLIRYTLIIANKAGRVGDEDLDSKYKADEDPLPKPSLSTGGLAPATQMMTAANSGLIIPNSQAISEALPMSLVTTTKPKTVIADEQDDTGAVDWYVDVDFPPIVQKEIGSFISALKNMFSMMPVLNVESQKLVVSMALTAFGVNDVDEVMGKLFTGDFSTAAFAVMPVQPSGTTAPGTLTPLAPGNAPVGQNGMPGAKAGVPKQPAETNLAPGQKQRPSWRKKDEK